MPATVNDNASPSIHSGENAYYSAASVGETLPWLARYVIPQAGATGNLFLHPANQAAEVACGPVVVGTVYPIQCWKTGASNTATNLLFVK